MIDELLTNEPYIIDPELGFIPIILDTDTDELVKIKEKYIDEKIIEYENNKQL